MKVLNLYCGIGGNRKLWNDVEVTAIDNNYEIGIVYADLFPDDKLIITDAHEYLLNHYNEFDFIWSSPPCQSHSSQRYNLDVRLRNTKPVYPDFKLYEEIIFLQYHCACHWVVENVNPYYNPLVEGQLINRHLFWSNFTIKDFKTESDYIRSNQITDLEKLYGYDMSKYKLKDKRQILRNCTNPKIGLHILNQIKL